MNRNVKIQPWQSGIGLHTENISGFQWKKTLKMPPMEVQKFGTNHLRLPFEFLHVSNLFKLTWESNFGLANVLFFISTVQVIACCLYPGWQMFILFIKRNNNLLILKKFIKKVNMSAKTTRNANLYLNQRKNSP